MSDVAVPRGERCVSYPCDGGPLLVRGADDVVTADGRVVAVTRPVVALCRCGVSTRAPWCDGAHKMLPPDRRPDGGGA